MAGVLELAGQDALLADRLAPFVRAGRLGREQPEQDEVILEEERTGVRVDDQPALPARGRIRSGPR